MEEGRRSKRGSSTGWVVTYVLSLTAHCPLLPPLVCPLLCQCAGCTTHPAHWSSASSGAAHSCTFCTAYHSHPYVHRPYCSSWRRGHTGPWLQAGFFCHTTGAARRFLHTLRPREQGGAQEDLWQGVIRTSTGAGMRTGTGSGKDGNMMGHAIDCPESGVCDRASR